MYSMYMEDMTFPHETSDFRSPNACLIWMLLQSILEVESKSNYTKGQTPTEFSITKLR